MPPIAPVPARLPRRLAAIVYDGLLLAAVELAAAALALGLVVAVRGVEAVKAQSPLLAHPGFSVYLLLVCFLFYAGFWTHGGQTLGLRAWRLRVQRYDGQALSWGQALLRFGLGALWFPWLLALRRGAGLSLGLSVLGGLLLLLALLAWRIPDRLARTEVVELPKPGKPGKSECAG